MTIEDNKAIARRFIQDIFVRQDPKAVEELVAPDFMPHDWGKDVHGRDAVTGAIKRTSAGLSDVWMTIEDMIAEGDRVAIRLTSSATQTGDFMGMPASGKRYEIPEIHIIRIRDGQVAEHWHQLDMLGMMRQLGAEPKRPGAGQANGSGSDGEAANRGEPAAVSRDRSG